MATRDRSRSLLVGAAVAALVAPLAVLFTLQAPASAAASRPHEVKMYKVEKTFAIEGEFPDDTLDTYLQCNPGDYVADGMWRIDSVDDVWDEGDFYAGNPLDVDVRWSYPDSVDRTRWNFKLQNYNEGRVQGKFFLTCISGRVDAQYGHDHAVQVTGVGVLNFNKPGDFADQWAGACPAGYLPITPGFKFNTGSGHLFRSRPDLTGGWQWGFKVGGPVNVDVYLSCLNIDTSANAGHKHKLQYEYGYQTRHVFQHGRWEETYSCDGSYKALVHWFDIYDWNHVWFLGMDPRIKSRAYTFWRTPGAFDDRVDVGALCVKSKTGKQLAP